MAKHAARKSKIKYWLARNCDNVSEWSDMSTRGLLFQWAITIKIQLSLLVWYNTKTDIIYISMDVTCSRRHDIAENSELVLSNRHSLTLNAAICEYAICMKYFPLDVKQTILIC